MSQSPRSDDYDFMKELEKHLAEINSSSVPAPAEERPPAMEADQSITARMDIHAIPSMYDIFLSNTAY